MLSIGRHIAIVLAFLAIPASAQVSSVASGDWTNPATWGGVVPTGTDNVVINPTHVVAINVAIDRGPSSTTVDGMVLLRNSLTTSGPAAFTISSIGQMQIEGGAIAGGITNAGTLTYANGPADISASANVVNNGLFLYQTTWYLGGTGSLTNNGTLRIGSTAEAAIVPALSSSGTIDVQTGALRTGAFTNSGIINISSGTSLNAYSGSTLNVGTTVTGAGWFQLNAASTLNVPATVTIPRLYMLNGVVNVTGSLTIGTQLDINGATLTTTAPSQLIIAPGATMNMAGVNLNGGLTNDGTIVHAASDLVLAAGATLVNNGLFDWRSGLSINSAGSFQNNGTLRRSAVASEADMQVALTSSGTIDIQTGALRTRTFTNSGIINIASGTSLNAYAGSTLNAGTTVTGAGWFQLSAASTLNVPATVTIPRLYMANGFVNVTGLLTIGTQLDINGSTLTTAAPSQLIIAPGATMNMAGGTLNGGLTNDGTIVHAVSDLVLASGATLVNNGLFDWRNGLSINSAGSFQNNGTLRRSVAASEADLQVTLTSSGTIDVQTGALRTRTFTNSGIINIASGTSLNAYAGSTLNTGTTVTGAGWFQLNGASTLSVPATVTIPRLYMLNGVVNVTGSLTIGTQLDVNGSTLTTTAPSQLIIGPVATMNMAGGSLNGGLTNNGTIAYNDAIVTLATGATLINNGLFDFITEWFIEGGGSFQNNGTIRKRIGTGEGSIRTSLINNGTVDVVTGRIRSDSYTQTASGAITTHFRSLSDFGYFFSGATPTFAGTLNVLLDGGFVPSTGNQLRPINLSTGARSGDFTTRNYPLLPNGRTWSDAWDVSGLLLTVVSPGGDITLTKSAPALVGAGQSFSYTINVTNNGPDDSTSVAVTDTLPAGVTWVSTSAGAPWTCSGSATVTCTAATVVPGPASPIVINVTAPAAATTLSNTATITSANDTNGANNSSTAGTVVQLPSVTIADLSIVEPDAGPATATFTLTLSAASPGAVTVDYATADGSATSGTDYASTTGTVTFAPSATTATIAVTINGDLQQEPDESFFVNLSNPLGATIADNQALGTISNNDPPPSISIGDVSQNEGNSGTTFATLNVLLSAPSGFTVTVNYSTADGTATGGSDYSATSGTLTFAPGVTTGYIPVVVNGDTLNEPSESFFVNLSAATNATIADAQGVGTIINDDSVPAIAINDITIVEGNGGASNATFTITLSAASAQVITVDFGTADGTASAGADYVATTGTVTFPAGPTSQSVTVSVIGDTFNEGNETFFLNLSNATNATIADSQAVSTIINDDGAPALSINDVTLSEGNSGTSVATFSVTLLPASGQTVTVNYATVDGTAIAGSDYAATSGTLTFAPGVTTGSVTVVINGDTLSEPSESFFIDLSAATNATISDAQGAGTITNDDSVPSISINDITVVEGNVGATSATFTATLSAVSGQTITVDYVTADGTATAGADYTTTSGSLTFVPGATSQTILVNVIGDTSNEGNETFFLNLSNATNATIGDSQAISTVLNDDGVPALSINDVTVIEGNSGTSVATFTTTLLPASGQTVTVNYATANGSAIAGSDYLSITGTLTFAPGVTSASIAVVVNGDVLNEPTENFLVNLTAATNATTADGQGVGTITNDDSPPSISINDVTLLEGNSGSTMATFTATLSSASAQTITFDFATADATATAGGDYVATGGTITFLPGATSRTVDVSVTGDTLSEGDETFAVNLSTATNASLADSQGIGTIRDDDALPALAISDVTVVEGNSGTTAAIFAVSLSAPSSLPVTVNYATSGGTATAGSDYTAASGTITFASGTTSATITVFVIGDVSPEGSETFMVDLSAAANAVIADNQGLGTITDDDSASSSTLSINDVRAGEGSNGTVTFTFAVTLAPVSTLPVTVNFATLNGTATSGEDYVATSGTLTFPPGTATRNVSVTVNSDTREEADETFFVNLSSATNAAIGDARGVGTISNDDTAPRITISDVTVNEGTGGTSVAQFEVDIPLSSQTVSVYYETVDGTAKSGSDYIAHQGSLTFDPGTTRKLIQIIIRTDSEIEPDETFSVMLTRPTNAFLARSSATGTILNDDRCGTAPVPTAPAAGSSVPSRVRFEWASIPGAIAYNVIVRRGNLVERAYSTGTDTYASLLLAAGELAWHVEAVFLCGIAASPSSMFRVDPTAAADLDLTVNVVRGQGTVTYELRIRNDGPTTASGVQVALSREIQSSETRAVAVHPSKGECTHAVLQTRVHENLHRSDFNADCTLGTLTSGEIVTVAVYGVPVPEGRYAEPLRARVAGGERDPDLSNNDITLTQEAGQGGRHTLTMNAEPDAPSPGGLLTYTVTYAGFAGDEFPPPGTVVIDLPPMVEILRTDGGQGQGGCVESAPSQISCANSDFLPGFFRYEYQVVTRVRPEAKDVITAAASLLREVIATVRTMVTADKVGTDLELTSGLTSDPVGRDEPVTYELVIRNSGPRTATGVQANVMLPLVPGQRQPWNGTILRTSRGHCTPTSVLRRIFRGSVTNEAVGQCRIGTLHPGEFVTVSVDAFAANDLEPLRANVSMTEHDELLDNNTVTVPQKTGSGISRVLLTLVADPPVASVGALLTYTATLAGGGSSTAGSSVVIELPEEVEILGFDRPASRAPEGGDTRSLINGSGCIRTGVRQVHCTDDPPTGPFKIDYRIFTRVQSNKQNAITARAALGDLPFPGGPPAASYPPLVFIDRVTPVINDGPVADLRLTTSVVHPNGSNNAAPVIYELRVRNNGPGTATDVQVLLSRQLGDRLELNAAGVRTSKGSCIYTVTPRAFFSDDTSRIDMIGHCHIGTLAAGEIVTVSVDGFPVPAGRILKPLEATAGAAERDESQFDNSIVQPQEIGSSRFRGETLTLVTDPPTASLGGLLTYTATVTSTTDHELGGISLVVIDLPSEVEIVGYDLPVAEGRTVGKEGCSLTYPNQISCQRAVDFSSGFFRFTHTVLTRVRGKAGRFITAEASLGGQTLVTVKTPVALPGDRSDLSVSLTGDGTGVRGREVTYAVSVGNQGPAKAARAFVIFDAPGLKFIRSSGACNTVSLPCQLKDLDPGSTQNSTLTFKVDEQGRTDTIGVSVRVISDGVDDNPGNDTATAAMQIACQAAPGPTLQAPAVTSSGAPFSLSWSGDGGASRYDVEEAEVPTFEGAGLQTSLDSPQAITRLVVRSGTFYYRVRAILRCNGSAGPWSNTTEVRVLAPPPPPTNTSPRPLIGEAGTGGTLISSVRIAPPGPGNTSFSIATDRPWLTVSPASGQLPPQGILVEVRADAAKLDAGTSTGTLQVTFSETKSSASYPIQETSSTSPPLSIPISISLVTPVLRGSVPAVGDATLIIPVVGHTTGSTEWLTDVRVGNVSARPQSYAITYVPIGPEGRAKALTTTVSVKPNDTLALDDIARAWFGVGAIGDGGTGRLEIRQGDAFGRTVATSRTFTSGARGSLGQFVPAIAVAGFARGGESLAISNVTQSAARRTNVGIIEASGQPADVVIRAFDSSGKRLLEIPLSLAGGEGRQLGAILAGRGIDVDDARLEVVVTSATGQVTAFASVVDSRTSDAFFVPATKLETVGDSRYVVPGVARLAGASTWRSDIRVTNPTNRDASAALTMTGSGKIVKATVRAGETVAYDDAVMSLFGLDQAAGALHVTTDVAAQLMVTGYTYAQVDAGKLGQFGQFVIAEGSRDAIGRTDGAVHVVGAEESVNYLTKVGLVEISGKPARVEVTVTDSQSKVNASTVIDVAANEFKLLDVLRGFGLTSSYNARISLRVVEGAGRITAYGSVVDKRSSDSTYIPAQ